MTMLPYAELSRLVTEMFVREELRHLIVYELERDISHSINWESSLTQAVFELIQELERRGELGRFFAALRRARPRRAAQIDTVARAFNVEPEGTKPDAALGDDVVGALELAFPRAAPSTLLLTAGIDPLHVTGGDGIDWRKTVDEAITVGGLHRLVAAAILHGAESYIQPVLANYPSFAADTTSSALLDKRMLVRAILAEREVASFGEEIRRRFESRLRVYGSVVFDLAHSLPDDAEWNDARGPDLVVWFVSPALLDSIAASSAELERFQRQRASWSCAAMCAVLLPCPWESSSLGQARFPYVPTDGRSLFDVAVTQPDLMGLTAIAAWESTIATTVSLLNQQRIRGALGNIATAPPVTAFTEGLESIAYHAGFRDRPVRPVGEVFSVVGTPDVTFVAPTEFGRLCSEVRQGGTGLVVEGPSGIGKTVAVRQAITEAKLVSIEGANAAGAPSDRIAQWYRPRRPDDAEATRVDTLSQSAPTKLRGWHVIDDFHLLATEQRRKVGDLIKVLSDVSNRSAKIVVIGIPLTGESLGQDLGDLANRFRSVRIGRETTEKIETLIVKGEEALNVRFGQRAGLAAAAQGSFLMAQRLCAEACAIHNVHQTTPERVLVPIGPEMAAVAIHQDLRGRFRAALRRFVVNGERDIERSAAAAYLLRRLTRSADGAVVPDDLKVLYPDVAAGFDRLVERALAEQNSSDAIWRSHIACDAGSGRVYTSDPQLTFFLAGLDWPAFVRECGLKLGAARSDREFVIEINTDARRGATPVVAAAPANRAVRLLHLSDLHFREETRWDSSTVLERMIDDLAEIVAASQQIDVIVVTGDVAFSGASAQYARALDFFRSKLLPTLGLGPAQLVLAPGNHDVARAGVGTGARLLQRGVLESASIDMLAGILHSEEEAQLLLKRHDAFVAFLNELGAGGSVAWKRPWGGVGLDVRGTRLHVAALCSSLFSIDDGDKGRLVLGLPQVNEALQGHRGAHVVLAAMHHPWSYFADWDGPARDELSRCASVVLRGHLHAQETRQILSPNHAGLIELAGGAAYESSIATMSYQILELDVVRQKLRVQSRQWSPRRRGWEVDLNAFHGEWFEAPLRVGQGA